MSKAASSDKAYKETLAEWRRRHFKEMDINLKINKEIRDNPEEKAKDRIDASKTIARMLGTLAPEKIEKKEAEKKKESPFTKAEADEINDRFSKILGDEWTGKNES